MHFRAEIAESREKALTNLIFGDENARKADGARARKMHA